jgi:hypothetical protein
MADNSSDAIAKRFMIPPCLSGLPHCTGCLHEAAQDTLQDDTTPWRREQGALSAAGSQGSSFYQPGGAGSSKADRQDGEEIRFEDR